MIYAPPRYLIILISKLYPDVLFYFNVPSDLNYISLTIDDFPNVNDLSISFELLDLLHLYNARCTFFTIGSHVEKYDNSSDIQRLFKRLKDDGHEVGNHGWRDEKAICLSENEFRQQIIDTEGMINKYTSFATKWFRPGSGFFNSTMIRQCTNLGYRLVLCSVYPHDPQMPFPKLNSYYIKHRLYPGSIVILHDRFVTIETLKQVLPAIRRRNFQIVTLTELMNLTANQ